MRTKIPLGKQILRPRVIDYNKHKEPPARNKTYNGNN